MKDLFRALRSTLKYKFTIVGIVVSSFFIAVLWGVNIGAVYPFVEVAFQSKSMHDWADESIEKSEKSCREIQNEIKDLESQQDAAKTVHAKQAIQAEIGFQNGRLDAERRWLSTVRSVEPWIKAYLPDSAFLTLVYIVGWLLIGTTIKCALLVCNMILVQRVAELTTFDLRNQFFQNTLRMELGVFGKNRTSDLMSRMTGDISNIGGTCAYIYGKATREPLKMIVCIVGAAWISWRLLVLSLVICPLMIFLMYRLSGSVKRANRRLMEETAKLFGRLSQALNGIMVVKAFNQESRERSRFRRTAKEVYNKVMKITFYGSLARLNNEILGVGVICLAILFGGYLVVNQETQLFGIQITEQKMSFGALMLFYAYLIGVSDPARKLADMLITVQRGVAACERVYPLLDQEPSISDPADPKPIKDLQADIVFENLSFQYTEKQPVLLNMNLTIPFGERLAIVGPNGCGKTTLVNLIPRFYDPVEGSVCLNDIDLKDVRKRDLRRQIGVVTQQTHLFDETVMENIRYASPSASDDEIIAAAKKAQAHSFITNKLEHGYETNVGEQGKLLSGGQRQRIALARAILRDPAIMILDEATSQVDPESELLLHKALEEFAKGRTTIMITHRMSTIAMADRILVMDGGQIEDIGTHDELIARCGLYQRLHQTTLRESA